MKKIKKVVLGSSRMDNGFQPLYFYPIMYDGAYRVDRIRMDYHGWEKFGIGLGVIRDCFHLKSTEQLATAIRDFELITNIL